ncbi:MAG: sulfatase [Flavobacteriaceae bacterium]|nr:sulfatase [Flavobacteriaceae bacterium]
MKGKIKFFVAVISFVGLSFVLGDQHVPEKPNIVFVLIDDMAWADVGYNNGAFGFYETPNIDAIAEEGIIFERFYPGGANCSPSRSCIVSGMYPSRTKIYQPNGASKGEVSHMRWYVPTKDRKGDEKAIDSRVRLEPSVISIAEVMNASGYVTSRIGKWHLGPDNQGFTESTGDGYDTSKKNYYNDPFATDRMTQSATEFFESNVHKPFFLYFSPWDVHTPIVAKKELVEKYQTKWASWPDKSKEWNPTYAAMIETVDHSIGILRKKLEDLGIEKNTLFMVTSDNGGHGRITMNLPLRGAKGSLYEGGIRTFATAVWPNLIKAGSVSSDPITGVDMMPTFTQISGGTLPKHQPIDGQSFANLFYSRKPLEKRSIFWHYPLYLEGRGHNKGWPGDNLLPIYGTDVMNWRAVPASAIMEGDWKLIYYYEYDKFELYDLSKDIGEKRNLAESKPEIAEKLLAKLRQWTKNTNADIPTKINPDFNTL